ncbi:MAG: sulfite exporter TauE/SafE family protein [Thermaurantimonas sp.]
MIGAAFILGIAGSLHCIGMCGPLAMAVPGIYGHKVNKWVGALLYHTGRSVTYAVFGLIFGALGKSFTLAGFQSWVSILAGSVMIVMGLIPFFQNVFEKFFTKIFASLKINSLRRQLLNGPRSPLYIFLLGNVNGLLPCGLVYVALAGALGMGSPLKGAVFMFAFGMGTLPAMYLLSVGGRHFLSSKKLNVTKIISSITVVVGILFVLRGADLGIPFLSPKNEALIVREATSNLDEPIGSCCTKSTKPNDSKPSCH